MRPFAVAVLVAVALALPACGDDDDGTPTITVLAAASLTEAFTELGGAKYSFAGSQALVTQLEQGAPADVIATADVLTMQRLLDAGLVDEPKTFAHNTLAIAVARGNPEQITSLDDLARRDLTIVLAEPSVPAGRYTRHILDRAGIEVRPRSLELDVKAALAKVTSGEADATIVYVSDIRAARGRADPVEIPTEQNIVGDYQLAVVADTDHRAAAERFVDAVMEPRVQAILRRHGLRSALE